ncbi:LysR family transcriptional regulator [Caballeronia sp. LZ001]|uniref:LysR family transcriptional regulator n=1 Tax=Caballeronia sp. LZ001 TaxID=3038553 RepID=UPI00285B9A23|nr:LysR family transcriptional regulator [Caballeronia sp. LZ001]MDR5801383.1 LysR family transcriptional regulator [Caballeronia sp. LZ001]
MNLIALADFNAVAQYGGFAAAARKLDRPKATLSRRVAELERELGVRLIERGSGTLRLTEDGQALHQGTHGLLADIADLGESIASRAPVPRGKLRVSGPVVFTHAVLARVAARFALAYPEVELELVAEDRLVDPVQDAYDLVIRVNPAADVLLMGRQIATDRRVLVAAPSLFGSDELPTSLPAITLSTANDTPWQIRTANGTSRTIEARTVLRMSSLLLIREAVLDGAGAALLPGLLVAPDVAAGRLVALGEDAGPAVAIWALYSSRRLLSAKVRAFLDVLGKPEC